MVNWLRLTMKEVTFPRSITTNDYVVPIVKGFHYDLLAVTLETLDNHLKQNKKLLGQKTVSNRKIKK